MHFPAHPAIQPLNCGYREGSTRLGRDFLKGSLKGRGGGFYSTFLLHAARSSWTGGYLEDGSSAAKQRGADDFVGGPGHLRAARFRSSLT